MAFVMLSLMLARFRRHWNQSPIVQYCGGYQ
ncbi:hypothetical protein [Escherichia phage vB_EcoS_ULIM2]|nr:hypothetical protein [Escherichia phage vB_EcoS_ULIM2]